MKIANIVCTYPPYKGGIGTAALNFRKLVSNKGHEVMTFTPDYGRKIDPEDSDGSVERLKPFLKFGNGAFIPALWRHLKNFDIIYLHYPFFGGAEVVWLFKIFHPKTKLIIRYHMDVVGLSPLAKILSLPSKLIEKSLFKKADMIVSASLDYIQSGVLSGIYKKYKDKFREIPYSVDTDKFKPVLRNSTKSRLLFVGGLDQAHYFKGVANLIEAVSVLKKEGVCDWELDVVGSGNLLEQYRGQAIRSGIGDKVNFLGKVSDADLPLLYADHHLTVLPSINRGEAFGIVLIESMASGTPVLASDLPGVRSVFVDGQEGVIVKAGDKDDLKNNLKRLLQNRENLFLMGERARKLAEDKYSREKISEKFDRSLNEVINEI